MKGRSKGGSKAERHVRVGRAGVEIRVNIVEIWVIGIVWTKTGVLEIVRIIWM